MNLTLDQIRKLRDRQMIEAQLGTTRMDRIDWRAPAVYTLRAKNGPKGGVMSFWLEEEPLWPEFSLSHDLQYDPLGVPTFSDRSEGRYLRILRVI